MTSGYVVFSPQLYTYFYQYWTSSLLTLGETFPSCCSPPNSQHIFQIFGTKGAMVIGFNRFQFGFFSPISVFLINVGMWKLPSQISTVNIYWEKALQCRQKSCHYWFCMASRYFNSTQLYFSWNICSSLAENTIKHIHFQDHRQEINAL